MHAPLQCLFLTNQPSYTIACTVYINITMVTKSKWHYGPWQCSKWLRTQVGWSFIEHSALYQPYTLTTWGVTSFHGYNYKVLDTTSLSASNYNITVQLRPNQWGHTPYRKILVHNYQGLQLLSTVHPSTSEVILRYLSGSSKTCPS